MEALGILKFWRNISTAHDVTSSDDDETDDDTSFFDFNFRSPNVNKNDAVIITNSKPSSPVTTLRSAAPKLKFFIQSFKKSSSSKIEKASNPSHHSNRFAASSPVLTRDNSLRSKMLKESFEYEVKSHVPKYLKLIKPLAYVKKAATRKVTDSVNITPSGSPVNFSPRKVSGTGGSSFKIVSRNLVKCRSAGAAENPDPMVVKRRDESLLEERDDGIRGAILHCKMSYAASSSQECSKLSRSASDTSSANVNIRAPVRNTCDQEVKRCSI